MCILKYGVKSGCYFFYYEINLYYVLLIKYIIVVKEELKSFNYFFEVI